MPPPPMPSSSLGLDWRSSCLLDSLERWRVAEPPLLPRFLAMPVVGTVREASRSPAPSLLPLRSSPGWLVRLHTARCCDCGRLVRARNARGRGKARPPSRRLLHASALLLRLRHRGAVREGCCTAVAVARGRCCMLQLLAATLCIVLWIIKREMPLLPTTAALMRKQRPNQLTSGASSVDASFHLWVRPGRAIHHLVSASMSTHLVTVRILQ
jgi:hypothetical protein